MKIVLMKRRMIMPMLQPLDSQLKELFQLLGEYREDRLNDPFYNIKDVFRQNPNDPYSVKARRTTVASLRQKIKNLGNETEKFNENAKTLVDELQKNIENNPDRKS